jgi:hypothetical protein
MKLNMRASAVLVWPPDGEHLALDSFLPQLVQPPPSPNPKSWWCLEDAIVDVNGADRDHGRAPWIKTGDAFIGSDRISRAYSTLRAARKF